MARVLIGTSGWTYRSWRGRFYPKYLTPPSYLSFYANSFTTTEINTSFYHLPLASSYEKWARLVPDNFVFSIKATRFITHIRHLVNVEVSWRSFVSNALSLQSHLGPILLQFPPSFQRTRVC